MHDNDEEAESFLFSRMVFNRATFEEMEFYRLLDRLVRPVVDL